MRNLADEVGIGVVLEGYPDQAYTSDGMLVPKKLPGAVITDPKRAVEQAFRWPKSVEGNLH